jgi:hypothetical protein
MSMQPAITRNSALYFAQRKLSKGRATLFRRFRAASGSQPADVRQTRFGIVQRLHQGNGR